MQGGIADLSRSSFPGRWASRPSSGFILGHRTFLLKISDKLVKVSLPLSGQLKLKLLTPLGVGPFKVADVHFQFFSEPHTPYPRLSFRSTQDQLPNLALSINLPTEQLQCCLAHGAFTRYRSDRSSTSSFYESRCQPKLKAPSGGAELAQKNKKELRKEGDYGAS